MVIALVVSVLLDAQATGSGGTDALARARAIAHAHVVRARALAKDPDVLKAVLESNASGESLADVRSKDLVWIARRDYPLRREVVARPCSVKLRKVLGDDPRIVEAFVMDERGALVCSTVETSDYWQGDEPKWQRTFQQGRESFVEEPALDASTGVYAVQLSVPISEDSRRVGALTFTLKLRRQELKDP
jgi:hypothetical protein